MEYIGQIRKNSQGIFETQEMVDHMKGTAVLAEKFSNKFNNCNWKRLLGLWHDLGKYSNEFQEYIKKNSGYEEGEMQGKTDHTSAAAILAKEIYPIQWPPIAYCIAGHHTGLHNFIHDPKIPGDLSDRLKKQEFLPVVDIGGCPMVYRIHRLK